jgi:hypothetical protein
MRRAIGIERLRQQQGGVDRELLARVIGESIDGYTLQVALEAVGVDLDAKQNTQLLAYVREDPFALRSWADKSDTSVDGEIITTEPLPRAIARLPDDIRRLGVTGDVVDRIPDELGDAENITDLVVDETPRITTLSDSIGRLVQLQRLVLRRMASVERLPDSMGNLRALRELAFIDLPRLQRLPKTLGRLNNLRTLQIDGLESLVALPSTLGQKNSSAAGQMDALHTLYVANCPLVRYIPDGIFSAPHLETLFMDRCGIEDASSAPVRRSPSLRRLALINMPQMKAAPLRVNKSLDELQLYNTGVDFIGASIVLRARPLVVRAAHTPLTDNDPLSRDVDELLSVQMEWKRYASGQLRSIIAREGDAKDDGTYTVLDDPRITRLESQFERFVEANRLTGETDDFFHTTINDLIEEQTENDRDRQLSSHDGEADILIDRLNNENGLPDPSSITDDELRGEYEEALEQLQTHPELNRRVEVQFRQGRYSHFYKADHIRDYIWTIHRLVYILGRIASVSYAPAAKYTYTTGHHRSDTGPENDADQWHMRPPLNICSRGWLISTER